MSTRLLIPKWAAEPVITDRSGMDAVLAGYNGSTGETLVAGDPNPIWDYLLKASIYGHSLKARGGGLLALVEMAIDPDTLQFFSTLLDIRRIVAMGGDLQGYPIFIQFAAAALSSNVPASWPNREYFPDPENAPAVTAERTIESYFGHPAFEQYPITFDSGTTYVVPNQDPWNGGRYLDASLWVNQNGVTLRSVAWYQSQLPQG